MKNIDINVSDLQKYVSDAILTESDKHELIAKQFSAPRTIRLLHSYIGMNTEITELFELLVKPKFDLINLREEAGDVLWYVAIALDELKPDLNLFLGKIDAELSKPEDSIKSLLNQIFKKKAFTEALIKATIPAGTLLDMMKKYTYYVSDDPSVPKKVIDVEKMVELLGKVVVCIAKILHMNNYQVKESLIINIKKLQGTRYKTGKFTQEEALVRNLDQERLALEGK